MKSIKINDKSLPWLFLGRDFNIPSFYYAIETEKVNGRPGSILKSKYLNEVKFDLPLIILNSYSSAGGVKTNDNIINDLVNFFNQDESVRLQIEGEEWYWNAVIHDGFEIPETNRAAINLKVSVTLTDPYRYALKGSMNTAISDQISVVNTGTADTPITVEARALKDSNFFMIAKGDEDYFMIGDDDVDKVQKDYSPMIYSSELRDFIGWNKQGVSTINDNYLGGQSGGSFTLSSSKESFTLNDAGTGTGWIGAEYKRSLSKQVQNFSFTLKLAVNQTKKGTTRCAQFIYDNNNRLLASIGYVNSRANQVTGRIIVTLFNESGDQVKIYDYPNNPKVYKYKDLIVYIRLTRVDDVFTIKTWKYKEIKYPERVTPIDQNERSYIDTGKFYQRPVTNISLYNAKHSTSSYMPTYILGTYNRELLERPKGSKDIIIKKGDSVLIDTKNFNVVVNEEPFLHEKTFGSDFFNVDKGVSELMIYPTGVFDTTVRWQERFI